MRHRVLTRLGLLLVVALGVQASGCGTLIYPERKGQKKGRIDPAVAILDGFGLLLFILPGLVAFVVDFNNGTIYLPPGTESAIGEITGDADTVARDSERWIAIRVGSDRMDAATIRTVVGRNTGRWIDLDDPRLVVAEVPGGAHTR